MLKRSSFGSRTTRFGQPNGPDPVAAGAKGGSTARAGAKAKKLQERILEGSGLESYAAYRTMITDVIGRERRVRAEERRLEGEAHALDARLVEATWALRRVDAEVAQLAGEADELERKVAELRTLREELNAAIASEAEAADMELVGDSEEGSSDALAPAST